MLNPFSAANPDRKILFPVWCAADGIGIQSALLAPWLIGIYISDYGFEVADAGMLLTFEFAVLALVNFLISAFMDRLPRRMIAWIGAIFVIVGNAASGFLDVWSSLAVARCLVGVGAGLVMAAGNATAAGAHDPAQLYGHKTAMLGLYAFALFFVIPPLVDRLGPSYLFLLMATFNMALVYPLVHLPQHTKSAATEIDETVGNRATNLALPGILIVTALLCFFVRDTMVYVFYEQIGANLDISRQNIGRLIAVSAVLAVAGPIIAIWLAHRLKETIPIVGIVILGGLLAHVVVQTGSQFVYGFLVLSQGVLNLAGLALIMSLASVLDPRGRITAACGGSVLAAYAISPALAGYVSDVGGTGGLQLTLFVWGFVTLALIFTTATLRRRTSVQQQSPG